MAGQAVVADVDRLVEVPRSGEEIEVGKEESELSANGEGGQSQQ